MIEIKNGAECICTKTYVFNDTVTFHEGERYRVDLGTRRDSNLLAVIQPQQQAYVGMSKSRFADYFEIIEKEKENEINCERE